MLDAVDGTESRAHPSLLLLCWFAVGCGGSSGSLFEPPRYPSARIAAREAIVELHEGRSHVRARRDFDTPLVSSPGQLEDREIALHPAARAALATRLQRLLGSADGLLLVHVTVVQGECGWRASWIAETAFARVALRVRVYDGRKGRLLLTGMGRANAEVSSMDVSDGESAELFDRVVVRAFEEVITQADFVALINEGLNAAPRPAPAAGAVVMLDPSRPSSRARSARPGPAAAPAP
jgi:hypothetical protein